MCQMSDIVRRLERDEVVEGEVDGEVTVVDLK